MVQQTLNLPQKCLVGSSPTASSKKYKHRKVTQVIGIEFVGRRTIQKTTSQGGTVLVSYGDLTTAENNTVNAMAFQISDGEGNKVAEFALVEETFGLLLQALHEMYNEPNT